ncbi:MAG: sulfide/dihydroorotate dehydrogenase-like FAD/NAD-binding protein [Clostridiales bacterium]|jgi:ferredoxin--NADP+ reductase|nr:sulfide/dihydroorotate dehydrogenase-like FAD/NAD-binding protein [Clostridiales bacterium]
MFKIIDKQNLNTDVVRMLIDAPLVAANAKPGQFIILRTHANGERIPLTIASSDPLAGTVGIIFQKIGKTTNYLAQMQVGDFLSDFLGPLGEPTNLDGYHNIAVLGGGLGVAIAYPIVAAFSKKRDVNVDAILGFRNKDLIILQDDLQSSGANVYISTDDGSNGVKGFVTDILQQQIELGKKYDCVVAIGPMPMMRAVCNLTKTHGIKTIVSMNATMVDGTGMCGCCRVTVDGKVKFACVDGPDFDGHLIDWDEAIRRSATYRPQEKIALDTWRETQSTQHECKLGNKVN